MKAINLLLIGCDVTRSFHDLSNTVIIHDSDNMFAFEYFSCMIVKYAKETQNRFRIILTIFNNNLNCLVQ